jgi:hypothetical protein
MAASLDFLADASGRAVNKDASAGVPGATSWRRCRGRRQQQKIYTISAFAWLRVGHG